MVTRTLAELAAILGGEVVGDGNVEIRGVAGIREAMPGDLTFLANARYDAYLLETRASAVICSRDASPAPVPLLKVDNPYLAFQSIVRVFRPEVQRAAAGVHPAAVVAPDAEIDPSASIGPFCVVESKAKIAADAVLMARCYVGFASSIGEGTVLYPGVVVREECTLGARCIIHPNAVIGADGFGFAFDSGSYHKIPQVGSVIIGDDVEIGANTTIDRATTDATRIGNGTKIDNLVQIGHNVAIGNHCIVVAQVGISGSTQLEDYVTIGGQAGLSGHIRLGRGSTVAGGSGVTKSVAANVTVLGYPAMPIGAFKRLHALMQRLPRMWKHAMELEQRLDRLEAHNGLQPQEKERVG